MEAFGFGGALSSILSVVANPTLCGLVHAPTDFAKSSTSRRETYTFSLPWVWKLGVAVPSFQTIMFQHLNSDGINPGQITEGMVVAPHVLFKCPKTTSKFTINVAHDFGNYRINNTNYNHCGNDYQINTTSIVFEVDDDEDVSQWNAMFAFFNWS